MMKILGVLILGMLLLSIKYNNSFYDSELYHLHGLPAGQLSIDLQTPMDQSTEDPLQIHYNQSSFLIQYSQKNIFNARNPISELVTNRSQSVSHQSYEKAFLLLIHQEAQINSFGDSFFKVTTKESTYCSSQVIREVSTSTNENKGQRITRIMGDFADCPNSSYSIEFIQNEKDKVDLKVMAKSEIYTKILIRFDHTPQNQYFGLGEQFSSFNLGHDRPYSMLVRQKGVGRGDQPETSLINILHNAGGTYYSSYCPMPIWYSSQKIAYILAKQEGTLSQYSYTAWMNNQLLVWLPHGSQAFRLSVIISSQEKPFKKLIQAVATINGYTSEVPSWVNQGAILGLQGGTEAVMQKYRAMKERGTVIKGLWLQDWVSKRWSLGLSRLWWNWQLDSAHYKGWEQMREQLKRDGVSLLIYMNPMLTNASQKDNKRENLYEEAMEKGYFIKLNDGRTYETSAFSDFKASLIDFDNPEAKKFYQNMVRNAIRETNAQGMMVDFSEAYPIANKHSSIEEAIQYHNQYPVKYHQAVREVLDEFPQFYSFTRAGFSGTPKYAQSLWAGDQNMNFKKNTGIRSCLIAMLSSSLVGYSNTHCDIGGYTFFDNFGISTRTPRLMTRWMQLAAFSPVFRTHEGNSPQKTLQIYSNSQLIEQFAFYSQVFEILSEYRREQWKISSQNKLPLVRPLFVELISFTSADNEQKILKIDDQYFLGEQLIVCPIVLNQVKRKYYLPKGQWIDLWTGEQIHEGNGQYREHNVAMIPVFIKKESKHAERVIKRIAELQGKNSELLQRYQTQFREGFFDL